MKEDAPSSLKCPLSEGSCPACPDECRAETGICAEPPTYVKGEGFSYIADLKFDDDGNVLKFEPFVDVVTLDIAVGFGTAHLPGPDHS